MTACFSADHFSFELILGPNDAVVRFSRGAGKDRDRGMVGEQCVPASVAADFIASLNAVIAREEKEIGGRYTTQHVARIAEGEPGSAALLDIASNDMPREFLEDMVASSTEESDMVQRIRTALLQDSFNRAYAIYMLAQRFAHQLGYPSSR